MTAPAMGCHAGAPDVVTLADALRRAGIGIGTGQVVTCRQAIDALGTEDRIDVYWAARTSLVSDAADLATFDRVFRRIVGDERTDAPAVPPHEDVDVRAANDRRADVGMPEAPVTAGAAASARERLRRRRFDRASDDELAQISALLAHLEVAVPVRRVRRTQPGRAGALDLGRTLERAMATDGELLERAWRTRRTRPRRLVILLDVSGSMADHARALLRFAVAARRTADRDAVRRVEIFAFGTRLTRLSDALAARDPDAAIAAAAARVVDWDGGTRIGDSLDQLLRLWGPRGILRGGVVVICSDGLERGDPQRLGAVAARLRRACHRIVWVNPLAGDARYEPSQRGMAAALPSVDVLLPGHDLASLEELSEVLARLR